MTKDCILDLNLRGSPNSRIGRRLDVLRQGSWILRWSKKIKNDIIFALGPQSLLLSLVVRNNSYIRFPSSIKDPNLHNARQLHVSIDGPTGLYSTIAINSSLSKWRPWDWFLIAPMDSTTYSTSTPSNFESLSSTKRKHGIKVHASVHINKRLKTIGRPRNLWTRSRSRKLVRLYLMAGLDVNEIATVLRTEDFKPW